MSGYAMGIYLEQVYMRWYWYSEYYLDVANDLWIPWEELIPRFNFTEYLLSIRFIDGMKIAKTDKQLNIMLALSEYLDIMSPLQ